MADPNSAPPPTPPRKRHRLNVRVTDIQLAYVRGRAGGYKVTVAEYVRYLVEKDKAELVETLARERPLIRGTHEMPLGVTP